MKHTESININFLGLIIQLCITSAVSAQIIPDNSRTQVPSTLTTINSRVTEIDGGTKRGENIFHVFNRFDIPRSTQVNFTENENINTLILKIKNNRPSNIDGTIKLNNRKNFLIISPSGINFGNRSNILNVKNFSITTANSIRFSDGFTLNKDTFITSTKRKSIPTEFIFNSQSSGVNLQGNGFVIPFIGLLEPSSLDIIEPSLSNNTNNVSIISQKINGNGVVVDTQNQINLIAVDRGKVIFDKQSNLKRINGRLGDINLQNHSLFHARGPRSKLTLYARKASIESSSNLYIEKLGGTENTSQVFAESLILEGANQSSRLIEITDPFLIFNENRASGIYIMNEDSTALSNLKISAEKISLLNGATVVNFGGSIDIDSESILVDSVSIAENEFNSLDSSIVSQSNPLLDSAPLRINAKDIDVNNGAFIGSSTFTERDSGSVTVNAKNINIDGFNEITRFQSFIGSASLSSGNSGKIEVESDTINLSNGATIASISAGGGNTSDLDISASTINISGFDSFIPDTGISSTVVPAANNPLDPNTPLIPTDDIRFIDGQAGNVLVSAETINISQGVITVGNFANQEAGNLSIFSNSLNLNEGRINASSINSFGGNIFLESDLIKLDDSAINSSALGSGTGGNITTASRLFLSNNSSVLSNAQSDQAGSISLNSIGFIFSGDSLISATSLLGPQFNGSIEINQTQTQINFPDSQILSNPSSRLSFDACTTDGSTLSQHGSGQHFSSIQDKQLYAEGLKQRLAIANQFTYTDSNGKEKPFRRWLGVQQKEDGELEMVFSPEQSKVLQNLLSSDTSRCINRS